MSKNNNVNPNFYKTAGREHTDGPDDGVVREDHKQRMSQTNKKLEENFIPGEAPVGVSSEPKKNK